MKLTRATFSYDHVLEALPGLAVILHKRQHQVFLLLIIDKMVICFVVPGHRLDIIHIEIHLAQSLAYAIWESLKCLLHSLFFSEYPSSSGDM